MAKENLRKQVESAVNQHGYAFQYAVIRKITENFAPDKSPWTSPIAEIPVCVNGRDTRIDFVSRHYRLGWWLVGECKRVNPALAAWCFFRVETPNHGPLRSSMFVEVVNWDSDPANTKTTIARLFEPERVAHVALEVKTGQKGDEKGPGRGSIEKAVGQVLKGTNGLIEMLRAEGSSISRGGNLTLIPVVVTTAKLYYCTANLNDADLESGDAAIQNEQLEECPWVFYHYHQSPGIRHTLETFESGEIHDPLIELLYTDSVRVVAIVSGSHLEDFLKIGFWYP